MEILFVAQTTANLYVMPAIEADNFLNGRGFSHISSYSFSPGTFGIKSLNSVAPGEYYVGIENTAAISNTYRVEVQQQPVVSGFEYSNDRFAPVVQNAADGFRFIQYVTLGDTYRTIIDGANTGGTVYLLPGSEANNFLNGSTFQYITNNPCGSGSAAPGFCELTFAPGSYTLGYVNDTGSPQAFVMYGRDYVPQ
ncbi:MAG: hypothetical protein IH604_16830 [Burkholderiales bacterium]|nr:hypothetical protein [Burkholderiales bacterium]